MQDIIFHTLLSHLNYSLLPTYWSDGEESLKTAENHSRTYSEVTSCSLASVQENESQWFTKGIQKLPL